MELSVHRREAETDDVFLNAILIGITLVKAPRLSVFLAGLLATTCTAPDHAPKTARPFVIA